MARDTDWTGKMFEPSQWERAWLCNNVSHWLGTSLEWALTWPVILTGLAGSGPRFNIKILSYQYRKSHYGDKTIVRSSYLHNGISYTGKMTSLYWIRAPGLWGFLNLNIKSFQGSEMIKVINILMVIQRIQQIKGKPEWCTLKGLILFPGVYIFYQFMPQRWHR